MKPNKITQEQISALADGEASDLSVTALDRLYDKNAQEDWDIYHRIGDILRDEELAAPLSPSFAARMAARLEAEAPHATDKRPEESAHAVAFPWGAGVFAAARRFIMPGAIGMAALVAALMIAPQGILGPAEHADLALTTPVTPVMTNAIVPVAAPENGLSTPSISKPQTLVPENDIVRDPRIDQYLMAHRRFSPSVYSSAQFARSAAFAAEADK